MNPAVEEALRRGRWGEIVTIEASTAENNSQDSVDESTNHISLTPRLDTQHGGFMWSPIPSDLDLSLFLRTKQFIFPMLNDHHRNKLYQRAIQVAASKGAETTPEQSDLHNTNEIRVLDVGCGTGLWGMVAARAIENPKNVTVESIDMSRFMVRLAQQVVQDNALSSIVQVKETHSVELAPPILPPKTGQTTICVSELLEHGLLGEGWIPTMRSIWQKNMIPPDAIVIPSGASVYAQAVQTVCRDKKGANEEGWTREYWGPHLYQSQSTPEFTLEFPPEIQLSAPSVVLPMDAQSLTEKDRLIVLSEAPSPILNISVEREALLNESTEDTRFLRDLTISRPGRIDAFLVWWKLHLHAPNSKGEDDLLLYSLDPNNANEAAWQDHWKPCLHVLANPVSVVQGDICTIRAWHTDERVHVSMIKITSTKEGDTGQGNTEERSRKRHRVVELDSSISSMPRPLSALRARQLNDLSRLEKCESSLRQVVQNLGGGQSVGSSRDFVALDVSDFCLSSLFLSHLWGQQKELSQRKCSLYSMESSQGVIPALSIQTAQLNLNRQKDSAIQFQVIQCHPESLSRSVLFENDDDDDDEFAVDLLLAEPYFEMTEEWPLLSAMNFYNIVQRLKQIKLLSSGGMGSFTTTRVVPYAAKLLASAITSPNLYAAYKSCGNGDDESVLGLSHSYVNKQRALLGEGSVLLSLPMWQYRYKEVSSPVHLTTLQYQVDRESVLTGSSILHIKEAGICHGFLVWIEYSLTEDDTIQLSTNSESEHQLVVLLDEVLVVAESGADVEISFRLNACKSADHSEKEDLSPFECRVSVMK